NQDGVSKQRDCRFQEGTMIRILAVAGLAFAVVFLDVMVSGSTDRDEKDKRSNHAENSRIDRGFAIAPVKLTFKKKNHDLVGLGSYIVNAQGGCNDCHSCPSYAPGHDPYGPPFGPPGGADGRINSANYLAGGVVFSPPGVTSANLTPDPVTGLPDGGHTF